MGQIKRFSFFFHHFKLYLEAFNSKVNMIRDLQMVLTILMEKKDSVPKNKYKISFATEHKQIILYQIRIKPFERSDET